MTISTFERNATIAEMAVEIDRRGAVIERLEAERDTLTAALAASTAREKAKDAEIAGLREALVKIENPVKALQDYAQRQGRQLDGHVAVQMSNDPNYLKGIARAALSGKPDSKE